MIILKIGGSAITVKDAKIPTIDKINLNRIADEIKSYNDDMIIVHGAGSYGHIYAKKYNVGSENNKNLMGSCITQNSVQELNNIFCKILQEKNIPVVGLQTSSLITTNNKRIDNCNINLISSYLKQGFIPVLYGDIVLDTDEKYNSVVISGDQIISYLALNLHVDKVILSSDVDGIYTKNPKTNSDAKLLSTVTRKSDFICSNDNNQADVTGGMMGKINELLLLADEGITSQIINAEKPGNIKKAVSGKDVIGTIIK